MNFSVVVASVAKGSALLLALVQRNASCFHRLPVIEPTTIHLKARLRRNTVPVKRLDTPTHSRVFLYLYYFLQIYEITHMESCSNQKKC